jgi:hypothetical protein
VLHKGEASERHGLCASRDKPASTLLDSGLRRNDERVRRLVFPGKQKGRLSPAGFPSKQKGRLSPAGFPSKQKGRLSPAGFPSKQKGRLSPAFSPTRIAN